MRSNENWQYYTKKCLAENAQLVLPEGVHELGTELFHFNEESVVVRFRQCFNIKILSNSGVNDDILKEFAVRPPYPSRLLQQLDFDKDWDALLAALDGYHLRKLIEAQQEQLCHYRNQTKVSLSTTPIRHFQHLEGLWNDYNKGAVQYAKKGNAVKEHICKYSTHWTATKMIYIQEDVQALALTDNMYIALLYNRISHLLSLYEDADES
ncbi:hypothetical protein NMY22_g9331 [Coprinellus aureogranulatus]|nr:hypothetical protein NMY22_g9331 [Coprinellus aureogranulatus]